MLLLVSGLLDGFLASSLVCLPACLVGWLVGQMDFWQPPKLQITPNQQESKREANGQEVDMGVDGFALNQPQRDTLKNTYPSGNR